MVEVMVLEMLIGRMWLMLLILMLWFLLLISVIGSCGVDLLLMGLIVWLDRYVVDGFV